MSKPTIFMISCVWDDDFEFGAGTATTFRRLPTRARLDELLAKISAMALDLLPDNHPGVDPSSLFLEVTALRDPPRKI